MLSAPFTGDPLGFYGKLIIEDNNTSLLQQLPDSGPDDDDFDPFDFSRENQQDTLLENIENFSLDYTLTDLFDVDPSDLNAEDHHDIPRPGRVGILGAGIGGLYTALMLDSLGIDYDILEASGHVGGRISTYKFENGGKYDYYEEGAMRFPLPKKDNDGRYKPGIMKRLADLTEYGPLNTGDDPLKGRLIPYDFSARDPFKPGFYYFNRVRQSIEQGKPKGSFKGEKMGVGAAYIKAGSEAIQSDVVNPFVRGLINDMETGSRSGWKVMKANDSYSTRGYMTTKYLPSDSLGLLPQHLSNDVTNWCNLLRGSSGWFDRALTESVFSAMEFAKVGNHNYGDVDWKCFKGGSEVLPKKIEGYLRSKGSHVQFHERVTSIRQSSNRRSGTWVAVTCNQHRVRCYRHVISTLPLPVLRTVDLRNAGLNTMQSNALRALDYGPSVKIAILFESDWWYEKLGIIGGQSFTDLPIRTIVYPSYGQFDSDDCQDRCKVLIVSYTSTTDASRLSALAAKKDHAVLKELVLRNLAEAHYGVNGNHGITHQFLVQQYKAMHVKDWNADEYAMGAFASFSPGQFGSLYSSLTFPAAGGRLHFAGEAMSTHHGWVVGALNSAWRAVYEYLLITKQYHTIADFKKLWGTNAEWIGPAVGPMKKRDEVDLLGEHLKLTRGAILAGIIELDAVGVNSAVPYPIS